MRLGRLGILEGILLGIAFLMIVIVGASFSCAKKPKASASASSLASSEKLSETIKKRLLDKDLDVRVAAAGAIVKMAEINAAIALPLVEQALETRDEEIGMVVAWAFSVLAREIPESSFYVFDMALADPNWQVRYHLVYAIRYMPRLSNTARLLVKLFDDPDRTVRFVASESRYFLARDF